MNGKSNLLKRISEFLSILIAFVGLLILIGWAFNIPLLLHPGSGFSAIKSNTGLAFLLIGISLWFIQTERIKFHNQRHSTDIGFYCVDYWISYSNRIYF